MRRAQRSMAAAVEQLEVGGVHAPVEVRRHPKARRMTLRVSRTRRAVIITLPPQGDLGQVSNFLTSNIEWLRKHLRAVPQPVHIADGVEVPFRGELHRVGFNHKQRRGEGIVNRVQPVDGMPQLIVAGTDENGPRRLMRWLIDQARLDLDARVQWHSQYLGLRACRLTLRDPSTRWGSCSSKGSLSFSWRLILAPPFVLDYVAAHEVAHLAEMNHGPRFWKLVRQTMPRCDEAKAWLDVYGMELHRYIE